MPLLKQEPDIYPDDLLDRGMAGELDSSWWAMYTLSRREKLLMRSLHAQRIPFYGPTIERRNRSPAGRVRLSYQPLFSNYVFVCGNAEQRLAALQTNCVSKCTQVVDVSQLVRDLHQVSLLCASGQPLSPESRLLPGNYVRVKNGLFAGVEGTIIRREGATRLLVFVNFMQQGASVLLDDCQLEMLDAKR